MTDSLLGGAGKRPPSSAESGRRRLERAARNSHGPWLREACRGEGLPPGLFAPESNKAPGGRSGDGLAGSWHSRGIRR
jgi:hypothetical protein